MSLVHLGAIYLPGGAGEWDSQQIELPGVGRTSSLCYLYYMGAIGGKGRIGLAIGEDGIHFTKLGVVLSLGATDDWDDASLFFPRVVWFNGLCYLYYYAYDGVRYRIGLAIGEDGIHFIKLGVVLPLGATGDWDAAGTLMPSPIVVGGMIYLYYTALTSAAFRVGLAISEDGIHFTKLGVVLPLGATGESDVTYAYYPWVGCMGGMNWLYYSGIAGGKHRLCAAISEDGIHFTKLGVVLPLGPSGDWDDNSVSRASAILDGGCTRIYYQGHDGTSYRFGLAISESGL